MTLSVCSLLFVLIAVSRTSEVLLYISGKELTRQAKAEFAKLQ
jgi:hypothetical protein